jgi:hypothetical protein
MEEYEEYIIVNGIVYLNSGTSCLPRLLVSIDSLRRNYTGDITLVQFGEEGLDICCLLQDEYKFNIVCPSEKIVERKQHFLEKTRLHKYVDYDNSLFIDSDTLIQQDVSELFEEIGRNHFVVPRFSDWAMSKGVIRKRTGPWKNYAPDLHSKLCSSNLPSINVGVFGFNRDSELMSNWYDFTCKFKNTFIPDESACHLLVHKFKNKIISNIYNYSCSKDRSPIEGAKIIHYHGKKHCRLDENGKLKYHGELWVEHFIDLYKRKVCNVDCWVSECGDKRVKNLISQGGLN